jgi:hypothetical protein
MCRYPVHGTSVQTLTAVSFKASFSLETVVSPEPLLLAEDKDYTGDNHDTVTNESTASLSEHSLSDQDMEEETATTETVPIRSSLKFKTQFQSLGHSFDDNVCHENNNNNSEKHVDFSTVEFRFYPIEMGLSPSVSSGPPLTIAWEYEGSPHQLDVTEYEATRPSRRSHHEMIVPRQTRCDWLRQEGYSRAEIQQAELQAQRDHRRYKACATETSMRFDFIQERHELVMRKFKKCLLWRNNNHKPSQLYQPWKKNQQQLLQQQE